MPKIFSKVKRGSQGRKTSDRNAFKGKISARKKHVGKGKKDGLDYHVSGKYNDIGIADGDSLLIRCLNKGCVPRKQGCRKGIDILFPEFPEDRSNIRKIRLSHRGKAPIPF